MPFHLLDEVSIQREAELLEHRHPSNDIPVESKNETDQRAIFVMPFMNKVALKLS